MQLGVSVSSTPLVLGALPALKVRYWLHTKSEKRIYTLARIYFLGQQLHVSLQAFESLPSNASKIGFVFGSGSKLLQLEVSPKDAKYATREAGTNTAMLPPNIIWQAAPNATSFAQSDEQGRSWGKQIVLPEDIPSIVGVGSALKSEFKAAVFKYSGEEGGIGASYKIEGEEFTLCYEKFDTMITIEY